MALHGDTPCQALLGGSLKVRVQAGSRVSLPSHYLG